jgi:hypothetical protein
LPRAAAPPGGHKAVPGRVKLVEHLYCDRSVEIRYPPGLSLRRLRPTRC